MLSAACRGDESEILSASHGRIEYNHRPLLAKDLERVWTFPVPPPSVCFSLKSQDLTKPHRHRARFRRRLHPRSLGRPNRACRWLLRTKIPISWELDGFQALPSGVGFCEGCGTGSAVSHLRSIRDIQSDSNLALCPRILIRCSPWIDGSTCSPAEIHAVRQTIPPRRCGHLPRSPRCVFVASCLCCCSVG